MRPLSHKFKYNNLEHFKEKRDKKKKKAVKKLKAVKAFIKASPFTSRRNEKAEVLQLTKIPEEL